MIIGINKQNIRVDLGFTPYEQLGVWKISLGN